MGELTRRGLEFLFRQDLPPGEVHQFVDPDTLRRRIERAIVEGAERCVVVGGDGMVALVATHVRGRLPIGIVPAGTTNVMAQMLGIPLVAARAFDVARSSPNTTTVDGLAIGDRLFLMNASVGLSSYSVRDVRDEHKAVLRGLAYVLAVLRSLSREIGRASCRERV